MLERSQRYSDYGIRPKKNRFLIKTTVTIYNVNAYVYMYANSEF